MYWFLLFIRFNYFMLILGEEIRLKFVTIESNLSTKSQWNYYLINLVCLIDHFKLLDSLSLIQFNSLLLCDFYFVWIRTLLHLFHVKVFPIMLVALLLLLLPLSPLSGLFSSHFCCNLTFPKRRQCTFCCCWKIP